MLGITRRAAVLGAPTPSPSPTPTPSFGTVWQSTGTPGTTVYAPGDVGGVQYSFGTFPALRSDTAKFGGKYYYELEKLETFEDFYAGFCDYDFFNAANPKNGAFACWYSYQDGYIDSYAPNGQYTPLYPDGILGANWTAPGNVLQVALDLDAGTVTLGTNDVWLPPVSVPWLVGRNIAIFMACPSSSGTELKLMMRTSDSEFLYTRLLGYDAWDISND